jgi:hypothetical protein
VEFGSSHAPITEAYDADTLEFTPPPAAVPLAELPALSYRVTLVDHFDLSERADDLEMHRGWTAV